MPRKKKSREVGALDRETFYTFIGDVARAKQRLDDANMSHAGIWKKAEPYGVHSQAAKLFCRLNRMEDTKRADLLRAFDTYRSWAEHWAVQADLLAEDGAEDGDDLQDDAGEQAGDDRGDDRDPTPIDREPALLAESEEGTPEVEAEIGEESVTEATEELAGAGYTFAAGRYAALTGEDAETNPHPEGSLPHSIWSRGYAAGVLLKDGGDEPAAPPSNGRRRRAAAEVEPAASVH